MVEYRGMIISRDEESQPRYQQEEEPAEGLRHSHHPDCRIKPERRATRDTGKKSREDVGLQRDFEEEILTQCGLKVLPCWLATHWRASFEAKDKCKCFATAKSEWQP